MRHLPLVSILLSLEVRGGAARAECARECHRFNGIFNANPGLKKVSFHGIPFFAITHDSDCRRVEFIIDSAGFWVQEATNEIILSRRPNLRHERAPVLKGVFAQRDCVGELRRRGRAGLDRSSATRAVCNDARRRRACVGQAILFRDPRRGALFPIPTRVGGGGLRREGRRRCADSEVRDWAPASRPTLSRTWAECEGHRALDDDVSSTRAMPCRIPIRLRRR